MKAFSPLIVVVLAMPILALPPVSASLPPVVHADTEMMVSIVSVITVLGLVLLSLLALCVEKGMHPFLLARRGFHRLPAWEKTLLSLFVGIWIAFASVKEGTNGVSQVEGDTNTVTQTEGNTNDWVNVEGTKRIRVRDA